MIYCGGSRPAVRPFPSSRGGKLEFHNSYLEFTCLPSDSPPVRAGCWSQPNPAYPKRLTPWSAHCAPHSGQPDSNAPRQDSAVEATCLVLPNLSISDGEVGLPYLGIFLGKGSTVFIPFWKSPSLKSYLFNFIIRYIWRKLIWISENKQKYKKASYVGNYRVANKHHWGLWWVGDSVS